MRSLKSLNLALVFAATFAMFGSQPAEATKLTQQIQELKNDYEYKLSRYQQAIKEGATSVANTLSKQVQQAKEKFERAKNALTPSEKTKAKVGEAVDTTVDTTTKVFDIGTGGISTATDHEGKTSVALKGYDNSAISIQGNNYCGQFAMTALLKALGKNVDAQKVYEDTNPWGIFTAPTTITEYLNMNGIDASSRQNASVSDIVKQIDNGYPALVLMSSDDKGTPHWVCVYGYDTDANGNVTSVKIRDSYWGVNEGTSMDINTFKERWSAPLGDSFGSKFVGYKNQMISIYGTKTPEKSPRLLNFNFTTATEDNIAGGINDVVTGTRNIKITQMLGGASKLVLGIPGAALGVISNGAESLADKGLEWGVSTFKQSGAANKIAGALVTTASGALKGVSKIGQGVANVLSGAASVIGNGIKKLGYVFRQN
jgi:hypothetical protein